MGLGVTGADYDASKFFILVYTGALMSGLRREVFRIPTAISVEGLRRWVWFAWGLRKRPWGFEVRVLVCGAI